VYLSENKKWTKYLSSSTRKLQSVYYKYIQYLVAYVNVLLVIVAHLFIYLYFTFHGYFGVNPTLDIGIVNIGMNTLHNTYHDMYAIASIHHTQE
jgi:hypothetical protein